MEIENLKLYLFTGTKHAAINKLRQENKHSRFCLENLHVEFISDYVNPEELTELHELESNIARAVKELPPACQLIYKLAKEDRLKYKDIAQLLDLSIKTIDHQLAIALKKIGNAIQLTVVKKNR
jgi:RNA polymerase sigma-70 factor (ECF subfamily)